MRAAPRDRADRRRVRRGGGRPRPDRARTTGIKILPPRTPPGPSRFS
ncbi:hypothetical protein STTU_0902 [Streptomyces sp. Tu6071]|nr:hypothetical protein STTU_0902 [Streptomyces sp. Tu6071]